MSEQGAEDSSGPIKGSCHCGAVGFTVVLSAGLSSARRCTCSFCRMRGAVAVSAKLGDFEVSHGAEKLTEYRFNTGKAKHYFCSVCGIYTHHQRRSRPDEYGVNVACLEGHSPFDISRVVVYDGVNHPKDRGTGPLVAGHLTFTPSGGGE